MKKYKSIILFLTICFIGCNSKALPDEIEQFQRAIRGNKQCWFIYSFNYPSVITLGERNGETKKFVSLYFSKLKKPTKYREFQKQTYKITVYDTDQSKRMIRWLKSSEEEAFEKSENLLVVKPKNKLPEKYFDSSNYGISIDLERIGALKSLNGTKHWDTFQTEYDLRGYYSDLRKEEGNLRIMVNKPLTQLREGYFDQNQWEFIRHVELGQLEDVDPVTDPETLIKIVWEKWEENLLPFLKELNKEEKINEPALGQNI